MSNPGLAAAARAVLEENWRGTHTVPAGGLYPHQWSWDSAFIAIGLRHVSPERARIELETLFGAQWGDGRLPQIVFDGAADSDYSPGPSFWRSERIPGSPSVPTAGLVQPPAHAWATWLVHEADPIGSRRHGFLARAYPRLLAWHSYLEARRDRGGSGLISAVHPWETGMDNSPFWDGPLSRVSRDVRAFDRPDLRHAAAHERPSNSEYSAYLTLAASYRDHECDDADEHYPFLVEDPAMNALWAESERSLALISAELGADPSRHRARASRISTNLESLWSDRLGVFVARDIIADELLEYRTVSGLVPMLDAEGRHADQLRSVLAGDSFALGRGVMVPSFDLQANDFSRTNYWRGPSWFNTAWLIAQALRGGGEVAAARSLGDEMGRFALDSDFAEYVDPTSGAALGTRRFSWTAALALDLDVGWGDQGAFRR